MPESPTSSELAKAARCAEAANFLGQELLTALTRSPANNVLLAPGSLTHCLAMALNGAAGATRTTLTRALHLDDLSEEELNHSCRNLRQTTATSSRLEVQQAAAVWGPPGTAFHPGFVHRLQEFYDSHPRSLGNGPDAADAVNSWVRTQTRGRIPTLINPEDLLGPVSCLLTTAMYFKGEWAARFDPRNTQTGPFLRPDGHSVEVHMMSRTGPYPYLQTEQFQAVALDYVGGDMAMYIVLPAPGTTTTQATWPQALADFQIADVAVTLPRFTVTSQLDLVQTLAWLGLEEVFRPGADFSRIGNAETFISSVKHATRIDVNEEGAEAAGSTAVALGRSLTPTLTMVVDHPFQLAIVDRRNGLFHFLGRISDPANTSPRTA
jgi:serine protease inhibitor